MKRPLLRVLLLVAAAALSGGATAQSGKCRLLKVVDWPVRVAGNHIVVEGAINSRTVGIILDTGAQVSLILRSAAVRLDLPKREAPGRRIFGAGGESSAEIATVDDFKLGTVSINDVKFYVAGEGFTGGGDVILGEDFLRRFDVEFDLANRTVRLFQPKDCEGVSLAYWTRDAAGEVEIEAIDENRPRISLTVKLNGRPIEAFLDSGAATSVLSTQDAAAAGVTPDSPGVAAGPSAQGIGAKSMPLWSGPFASFAIGNESIADVRIRFADLFKDAIYSETGSHVSRRTAPTQPMLLGADFLQSHRTLVSHSQRRLYFTYVGGPAFMAEEAPRPAARQDGNSAATSGGR
ncbi:MAG: retroviral-like aspartic protease family protein [Burkholderiales bacterium]